MDEKDYQELIIPYRECLRNVENRLRILAEDYRDRYGEEPIHHIQTRIKTKESIEGKLIRREKEQTAEDARDYLRDIAGIRVICYDVEGIYKLARALKRQGDLETVKEKDYISHPKPNGYKSYHLVTGVPIYRVDGMEYYPVEVQFRTMAMDLWASLEHRSCYKRKEEDKQAWSACFLKYSHMLEQMEQAVADYGKEGENPIAAFPDTSTGGTSDPCRS
ncbi:MAG TPA: (p)ppGpp synthetase [Candidatus Lachnoclostridium stercorigallinarum]|uniref:(P)ppGpp synthetase n=1 Tax=Candidatus Lachnoclostridium stercorigallinarum TaxID=2838634 RepID=A0A9D2GJA7_9FIRM|nr:(p)ppGpp synthetase [Candidatus Lachnoclostridium stercorigallinarum]